MALVPLESLQHVRVVADDEIRAGIDGRVSGPGRELAGDVGELEPAVDLDDHEVGAIGAQLLDRASRSQRIWNGAAPPWPRLPPSPELGYTFDIDVHSASA